MKWTDNKRKAFEKAAGRTSPAGGAQIQGGGSTPQPTTPPPATAEEANQANPLEGGGTIQHGPATQPPSAPSTNSQPQSPNARGGACLMVRKHLAGRPTLTGIMRVCYGD
jgi:hypothetical protein